MKARKPSPIPRAIPAERHADMFARRIKTIPPGVCAECGGDAPRDGCHLCADCAAAASTPKSPLRTT